MEIGRSTSAPSRHSMVISLWKARGFRPVHGAI
jgi:hypothetical protein